MTSIAELVDALEREDPSAHRVVLMPDFSLDHLMRFPRMDDAVNAVARATALGNGEAHPTAQLLRPGGGATNVAHALARLGCRTHLVARTSPVGLAFLDGSVARDGVDVSRVRGDGRLVVTGAMETADASLMLNTPREDEPFAADDLRDEDWDLVAASDAVYVGDWMNPHARELTSRAWAAARRAGARTYTDAGAPPEDPDDARAVLDALASPHLDAVSVNPLELGRLVPEARPGPRGFEDAGRRLSRRVEARVDLHSTGFTASFRGGRTLATAPSFRVQMRQATGGGDTWNAGIILGDLLGLDDEARLVLANALAALYVAADDARPPTLAEVARFLRTARIAHAT